MINDTMKLNDAPIAASIQSYSKDYAKERGDRKSKYYTAKQVRIIFERLGEPG